MSLPDNRKRLRNTLRFCIPYVLISFFFYHIDKLLTYGQSPSLQFVIFFILFPYLMLCNLVLFVIAAKELYIGYRCRKRLRREFFYPLLVCVSSYLLGFMGPVRPSSECFESKAVYKGYIEGTVSHSVITMRANGRLEINNSAIGMSHYSYGNWIKNGDTIFLKHDDKTDRFERPLSDTLIVSDIWLVPYSALMDTSLRAKFRTYKLTTKP